MSTIPALDLGGPLPRGWSVIEASAGTGKTYALTALAARFVVEHDVRADQLLVVTFTRAAASELRERLRARLVELQLALAPDAPPPPAPEPWLLAVLAHPTPRAEKRRRAAQAIARFDDATVTTIHAFCQQTLRQVGVRGGAVLDADLAEGSSALVAEVCRDLLVARLAHDPLALSLPTPRAKDSLEPRQVEGALVDAVKVALNNPGARLVPDLTAARPSDPAGEIAQRWAGLVHAAVAEVHRRRALRRQVAFDDLITHVHRQVTDPTTGPSVQRLLRQRYELVLVDEFQDTDPVQWEIFRGAFHGRDLVVVGDPKQAIYRFRGADVAAYLDATEAADGRYGLTTNHRSDGDLVAALNALLDGTTFGDPRIGYVSVSAAPGAPARGLQPADLGSAVEIRWVPDHPDLRSSRSMVKPKADAVVRADLAQVVVDLLERGTRRDHLGVEQKVVPGDVAVLVRSHADVDAIVATLREAGVPAVSGRAGNVLSTRAATEWHHLLAAVARPHRPGEVRAAACGWFFGWSPARLVEEGDEGVRQLQETCAQLGDLLHRRGVPALFGELRVSHGLLEHVLARPTGERDLTDLEHVAELLAQAAGPATAPPAVLRAYEDLLADAPAPNELAETAEDATPEERQRRVDSDAAAVHVGTIHAAKGLEYPVVLLPWPAKKPRYSTTFTITGPDGRRCVDVASKVPWVDPSLGGVEDQESRRLADKTEGGDDELRLLYVALTRARHRVVLWWAPTSGTESSALAGVLFGDDRSAAKDNQRTREVFDRLVARSAGRLGVTTLGTSVPMPAWEPTPTVDASALAVAELHRPSLHDAAWRRWSFSAMARAREQLGGPDLAEPPPLRGGLDEPEANPEEPEPSATPPATGSRPRPPAATPPGRLLGIAGGTAFGTLVHAVLEKLDPTAPDLHRAVSDLARPLALRSGLTVPLDDLVQGLVDAVTSPLGPQFGGRCLADIAPCDRLAELDFHLPLAGTTGRFAARDIGEALLAHLPGHDPVRPYAAGLAAGTNVFDLAGELHGSIDAVLRLHDGVTRYVVVDYKTNRLPAQGPDPTEAYRVDVLATAMAHHHYPLQALLYLVATHRYLRWRQPGYDPDRHLAGAAYLFLRGMVGPATPSLLGWPAGVFSWQPPAQAVLAVDHLLATGRLA